MDVPNLTIEIVKSGNFFIFEENLDLFTGCKCEIYFAF